MAPWPEGRRKEDEFDRTDVQRNGSQTGVCTQITQRDNLTSVLASLPEFLIPQIWIRYKSDDKGPKQGLIPGSEKCLHSSSGSSGPWGPLGKAVFHSR